jgi:hypothetical protein
VLHKECQVCQVPQEVCQELHNNRAKLT